MSDGETTQPAQQDVKPDVKGNADEGQHLNLKVKAQVCSALRGLCHREKPQPCTPLAVALPFSMLMLAC